MELRLTGKTAVVTGTSPGPVSTDLWLGSDGVAAGAASQSITGRFTRPDEVADLVVFLASGRAGNVTGADFRIDGGLITTV